MAGLRAGLGVVQMHLDDVQGTLPLPLRRLFPGQLAVIAERLAIGAIDFMRNAGDFFLGHSVSLAGVVDGQALILPASGPAGTPGDGAPAAPGI